MQLKHLQFTDHFSLNAFWYFLILKLAEIAHHNPNILPACWIERCFVFCLLVSQLSFRSRKGQTFERVSFKKLLSWKFPIISSAASVCWQQPFLRIKLKLSPGFIRLFSFHAERVSNVSTRPDLKWNTLPPAGPSVLVRKCHALPFGTLCQVTHHVFFHCDLAPLWAGRTSSVLYLLWPCLHESHFFLLLQFCFDAQRWLNNDTRKYGDGFTVTVIFFLRGTSIRFHNSFFACRWNMWRSSPLLPHRWLITTVRPLRSWRNSLWIWVKGGCPKQWWITRWPHCLMFFVSGFFFRLLRPTFYSHFLLQVFALHLLVCECVFIRRDIFFSIYLQVG